MKKAAGRSANRVMAKSMRASNTTLQPTMGKALMKADRVSKSMAAATTRSGDPLRPKPRAA